MALFGWFSRRSSQTAQVSRDKTSNRQPAPPKNGNAYLLVVDESASTHSSFRLAFGCHTTRIEAIRRAARKYLRQLMTTSPHQKVGLVGFSETATLYHPLSPVGRCFHSIDRALRCLHPQFNTNLSAGLDLALGQLAGVKVARPHVVVITDGAANIESYRLPGLIKQARSSGVRIFTIGIGNNGDSDYDRVLLVRMARTTGGRFRSAHSFEALCKALRRIG